ncbi:MAG: histidine phosphatase family protein [Commensalibacter sp.]
MSYLISRPYWYLRHGQTDWNARNLSQGRTDVPLNRLGLAQAEAAGHALADAWSNLETPIARIVSSPLGRARMTAEITAQILREKTGVQLPIDLDDSLKEVCFGVEEAKPMGPWYDQWIAGQFTPAGGEPFKILCNRVRDAVNRAIMNTQNGHVMIVAHGGIFRSLRFMMGLKPNVRLPNAQPIHITPPPQGEKAWTLNMLSVKEAKV